MTNKTEMVSVPRELLERIVAIYASSTWPSWYELRAALEATPAEDVRAVVEGPVAEVISKFGDPEAFGERELVALLDIQALPYGTKLYRHPPRPMVLPERREPSPANPYLSDADIEWNACLDKIAELNK